MTNQVNSSKRELPIVCNLPDPQQAIRREELSSIFNSYQQKKELSDGYAFSFPGDKEWIYRLADFIIFERQCCPFFTFELVFEPEEGAVWLHLRGGSGVKTFIKGNLI